MGFLSKVWKGVKKAVKGVAKGVKKVAKGITTSLPGGHKLWKASTKLGKKLQKGFAKFVGKIGPVGMMALSFVLAPVMGPMLGALWSSFGVGAEVLAASSNAFVAALGTAGEGIFAAGNWLGGTLGAMGEAIVGGGKQILSGNFSAGLKTFTSNMTNALTGQAGMASVNAAAAQAAAKAGTLAGQLSTETVAGLQAQGITVDPALSGVKTTLDTQALGVNAVQQGVAPNVAAGFEPLSFDLTSGVAPDFTGAAANSAMTGTVNPLSMEAAAQQAITGKVGEMSLMEQSAFIQHGAEGVKAIQPGAQAVAPKVGETIKKTYDTIKDFTNGDTGFVPFEESQIPMPSVPGAIQSASGRNPQFGGGVGSSGFSLLAGVQGLEQSIRNSQRMMFSN